MKQLSALGARRAFFRNPRRMRGMPDDSPDLLGQPGFNFYPGRVFVLDLTIYFVFLK